MIDMHTHILPYIDDGAADEETALQMVDCALAQGVETLVFTPHYYGKLSTEEFLQKRQDSFACIQNRIPKGIQTYMGAEVHFDGANLFQFEALMALTIGDTRYIIIELPFIEKWSSALLEKLNTFMDETDCTPILAHIERYLEVRKNPALVSILVNMGCLIQVNTRAFLEKTDRNFAFTLLKKGLVHCLGSDTHDMDKRISDYQKAKEEVERAGYGEQWERIQGNMERVLEDRTVRTSKIKKVKKLFGFYY